jgi:two-component system cell cycle sensor histidine kinase/response regulator CckA
MNSSTNALADHSVKAVSVPRWLEWRGVGDVLVIDDDDAVRTVLVRTLAKIGFTVSPAADGEEAVALFNSDPRRYSLVLLDFKLPGMDSMTVFSHLRAARADVPVILMSGYGKQEALENSTGLDFAEFLSKPFTVDTLATTVRTAVGG